MGVQKAVRKDVGTTREGADKEAEVGRVERTVGRLWLTGFYAKVSVPSACKSLEDKGWRVTSGTANSFWLLLAYVQSKGGIAKKGESAFAFSW